MKQENHEFDAIVIGSGVSGGWAAKELTEKGLKTLVVERGRPIEHGTDYITENTDVWDLNYMNEVPKDEADKHWPIQQKCYAFKDNTKHFFTKDSEHTYIQEKPFDWIKAFQLGGKSLLWHRQSYRFNEMDFEANKKDGHGVDWPVRYSDLAPWYDYVEKFAGISGSKEGLAVLPDSVFQKPIDLNAAEKFMKKNIEDHYDNRYLIIGRTAHLTEPTEEQMELGRAPCQSRNQCQRGCSFGAYFSSLSATLPAAERTGNLTIMTHSVVHSIVYDEKSGKASGVRIIDANTKETKTITARVIFTCASTLASTQILLNSKSNRYPTGIGNSSGVLGHYLMDHLSSIRAGGRIDGFEDSFYFGRRPTGIYIPRYRNVDGDKQNYLRGFGFQGGAERSGWKGQIDKVGVGADYKKSIQKPGGWYYGMTGFAEMLPYYENHMRLSETETDDYGIPLIVTSCEIGENERKMIKDMATSAREMLAVAGVKDIYVEERHYTPGIAIHEVGTACMGHDPRTSYLNGYNQSHDVPNLFVTDGSAFASESCVNPSLTFMAFTARAVDYAVKQMQQGNL